MSQNKSCELFTGWKEVSVKGWTVLSWYSVDTRYSVNRPVETHMSGPSNNLASQTQVSFCLPSSELNSRYKHMAGEKGGNSRFES